jgi:uncharacterized damage-inducible protein DinB
MLTLDGIRKFHTWTHASLSLLFDHLSTLPLEQYTLEIPNFGSNTIQKQVAHILNCEGLWISSLQQLDYVDRSPLSSPRLRMHCCSGRRSAAVLKRIFLRLPMLN